MHIQLSTGVLGRARAQRDSSRTAILWAGVRAIRYSHRMRFAKLKRRPRERLIAERLMWGDLIGASPVLRNMAASARAETEQGLSEAEVRQRIRSRMQSEGMTTRAWLLPSLSRKMLRVKLKPLLHALADLIASKTSSNRLGAAIEPWFEKLGIDQWFEDFIWHYAQTGETSPIFDAFTGKAFVHEMGPQGNKTPAVWLIATPASDVRALVEEFIELAETAFPDETFSKRFESLRAGARYLRLHEQLGLSYGQIARKELSENRPDLETGSDSFKELLQLETERITKAADRSSQRADRIVDFLSADSGDTP